MTKLLVSVRDEDEAVAALAGGADIIDVKEPARGALGRPEDAAVLAVARRVADAQGSGSVSVALGELVDRPALPPCHGLLAVKVALAGCRERRDWQARLAALARTVPAPTRLAVVAYADADRAAAPPVGPVLAAAVELDLWFLVDTWQKDGHGLLDWLPLGGELPRLADRCRDGGLHWGLAGSLTAADVPRLLSLRPNVIAVRGAACRSGDRTAAVDSEAVARLAAPVRQTPSARDAAAPRR
jgi:uncharacterized protein (UPF0264 family)